MWLVLRGGVRRGAGIACWVVQPLYLVLELAVAAAASASYSLRDDTISTLGQIGCASGAAGASAASIASGAVEGVCSPGHAALNAGFVIFGLLRAVGALLLRDQLAPSRRRITAVALWVGSGVFSAAVGIAPVDTQPTVHGLVAAPLFVLQPLAVVATALAGGWRPEADRVLRLTGLVAGGLSVAGALAFGARLGQPTWLGAAERLALWPGYLWLGLAASILVAASWWKAR
ncbi:MAG: DUF998 domain-containing protein [Lapillicoccus sp.]